MHEMNGNEKRKSEISLPNSTKDIEDYHHGGDESHHKNVHGLNWWVTGLFKVGECAGEGLVTMPSTLANASLRGVTFKTDFFMHPLGKSALTLDLSKTSFVQIDLTTGEQTVIKTEWPHTFQFSGEARVTKKAQSQDPVQSKKAGGKAKEQSSLIYPCLTAVTHGQSVLIYSLFAEDGTKKIFTVIFSLNNGIVTVIDEKYTNIVARGNPPYFDIQVDRNGLIRCFSLYRIDGNKTIFQFAKIRLDETGHVFAIDTSNEMTFSSNWHRTVLLEDCYYLLKARDYHFLKQLGKFQCQGEAFSQINISNAAAATEAPHIYYCTPGEIIGSKIFFYAYVKKDKAGLLLCLDLSINGCTVRKWPLKKEDHVINSKSRLRYSSKGFIYLHGSCVKNCKETHINRYTIPV